MTDTTPVPPVPSREAVEKVRRELLSNSPIDHGEFCRVRTDTAGKAWEMLRTLLAEVERLNQFAGVVVAGRAELDEELCRVSATVADQAAALAERDKDAEYLTTAIDQCCYETDLKGKEAASWIKARYAALAASVSTQEEK